MEIISVFSKRKLAMADHRWLGDVLADLAKYCIKNKLEHTLEHIRGAQVVLEAECELDTRKNIPGTNDL